MIENFVPQPYPLECSAGDGTWMLVIGWSARTDNILSPIVAHPDGGTWRIDDTAALQYRPVDPRPSRFPATTATRAPRNPSSTA